MRRMVFCLCMTSYLLLGSDAFFLGKWGLKKTSPFGQTEEEEKHKCDRNMDHTCEEQNHNYDGNEILYEGDIAIRPTPHSLSNTEFAHVQRKFWDGGKMYYRFDENVEKEYRKVIQEAIDKFGTYVNSYGKTRCVHFEDVTEYEVLPNDYVHIRVDSGCFSNIGMLGGEQTLALSKGLLDEGVKSQNLASGTIWHELMHSLGFYHEQNRPDRNDYLQLHTETILDGYQKNFDILDFYSFGLRYNFLSIMHYSLYAFTKNGEKTMTVVKLPHGQPVNEEEIGQRRNITYLDIMNVRKAYGCFET